MLLDTLMHEMIHVRFPQMSEQDVRAHTTKRMKKMGWREKARFLKLLGNATIEGEE
jgi:hypothetical protein